MKNESLTVEELLRDIYRAPVKTRHAAMLAAARVLANKPEALLCSQADASRLLGVSRFTVWRMTRETVLHPVNIRGALRYRVAELEQLAAGSPAA